MEKHAHYFLIFFRDTVRSIIATRSLGFTNYIPYILALFLLFTNLLFHMNREMTVMVYPFPHTKPLTKSLYMQNFRENK